MTPTSSAGPITWVRRGLFTAIWLVALYGVWISAQAMLVILSNPPAACIPDPSRNPWSLPPPIIWISLAAFAAGGLLGEVRDQRHHHVGSTPPPAGARPDRGTVLVLGLAVLALILLIVLMAFETYATASGQWPISKYVRCAYLVAPLQTTIGASLILFVLGHWLWYVPRLRRP